MTAIAAVDAALWDIKGKAASMPVYELLGSRCRAGVTLERFANPALRHRTTQIVMDGSQKLPQRLLDGIRDRRRAGAEPAIAGLGVAAWMRFVSARRTETGQTLTVDDPLGEEIARRLAGREEAEPVVDALLSMHQVFGEELAADAVFRGLLVDHLDSLIRDGAEATTPGGRLGARRTPHAARRQGRAGPRDCPRHGATEPAMSRPVTPPGPPDPGHRPEWSRQLSAQVTGELR
jgi:hypothetical protein